MLAHIEQAWLDRLKTTPVHRYLFDAGPFEDLGEAGMWVSRWPSSPSASNLWAICCLRYRPPTSICTSCPTYCR
jgi:hypothetical protein